MTNPFEKSPEIKNLFENISEIKQQIEKAGGAVLLFDFDGVLSAIAPTPDDAIITEEYTSLFRECAARMPAAIITGRTMTDIKKKINAPEIFYMASHGLEWEEDGKDHMKPIPEEARKAINVAKEKMKPLLDRYPGMLLEDKSSSIVIHYRLVQPELNSAFIKEVESILGPYAKEHRLRLDNSIMNFELRPSIDWDKGDSVIFATDNFRKKTGKDLIPIYIGDSETDEDAFAVLLNKGISIRVNSSENENIKSKAKYYMRDQKEVGEFMKWLLSLQK